MLSLKLLRSGVRLLRNFKEFYLEFLTCYYLTFNKYIYYSILFKICQALSSLFYIFFYIYVILVTFLSLFFFPFPTLKFPLQGVRDVL